MRIAVLILALLGGIACAGVGVMWFLDLQSTPKTLFAEARRNYDKADAMVKRGQLKESDRESLQKGWFIILGRVRSWPFMLAALALATAAAVLAMKRRGFSAAALLLTAVVGPGVLFPPTLIFSSILVVAGVLALFIRAPRPKLAPAAVEEIEDVEELAEE